MSATSKRTAGGHSRRPYSPLTAPSPTAPRAEAQEMSASDEVVEPLADMATVAEAAHTAHATWLMVAVTERAS